MERKAKLKTCKNVYGQSVNVCCASCKFKGFFRDGKRKCTLSGKEVRPQHHCCRWQMNEACNSAGRQNGGKVKSKDYLMLVMEIVREQKIKGNIYVIK